MAILALTIGHVLLAASPAAGQTSATLAGRVEDSNGNARSGVTVTATHLDTAFNGGVQLRTVAGSPVFAECRAADHRLEFVRLEPAGLP